jgi:hypothetical protein
MPKCDPPVFDVFYLHKYSHGFSYFNDIVIQIFQKTLVMTMATLMTGISMMLVGSIQWRAITYAI